MNFNINIAFYKRNKRFLELILRILVSYDDLCFKYDEYVMRSSNKPEIMKINIQH